MEISKEEYLKPHFNPALSEVGFRIGLPFLKWEISKTPAQRIKNTRYNKVTAHGFSLKKIAKDGLVIALSIRWKRYADDPINGGTFVLGQSNCDGKVLIPLIVSADHRVVARKPLSLGFDCTSSGIIDPVSIFDHLAEGGTWIFSGGNSSSGCVEILLNLGGLFHNFVTFLDGNPIFASDPVETEVLQKELFPFVKAILDLDQSDNEVFLSDIRFDPAGVWFVFIYPERLYALVQSLVDKVEAWLKP